MADIGRWAKVRSEFLAGLLQGLRTQGFRLAPDRASPAQAQKLDDATGDARCQLQDVIDGNLTPTISLGSTSNCCKNPARKRRRTSLATQAGGRGIRAACD